VRVRPRQHDEIAGTEPVGPTVIQLEVRVARGHDVHAAQWSVEPQPSVAAQQKRAVRRTVQPQLAQDSAQQVLGGGTGRVRVDLDGRWRGADAHAWSIPPPAP
jgi:hypothetical protein